MDIEVVADPVSVTPELAAQDEGAARSVARGEYVAFPPVGIEMIRPEGFEIARDFHGFQLSGTNSSVLAMILPGPMSEIVAGFTEAGMKEKGMTLRNTNTVVIDGMAGLLFGFDQDALGQRFSKWALAIGNETATTMVTATFPVADASQYSALLKTTLLSVRKITGEAAVAEQGASFTIEESDLLKDGSDFGKGLVITKDGVFPLKSLADPFFTVMPSVAPAPDKDRRRYAIARLSGLAGIKISRIGLSEKISIDGLHGFELAAEAVDTESEIPLAVYQVLIYRDDGTYFVMVGMVGASQGEKYFPEFERLARSFLRDAP